MKRPAQPRLPAFQTADLPLFASRNPIREACPATPACLTDDADFCATCAECNRPMYLDPTPPVTACEWHKETAR
jgi:hypothetical protein